MMSVLNFSYMAFREQMIMKELLKKIMNLMKMWICSICFFEMWFHHIFILNLGKKNKEIEFINWHALRLISKTLEEDYVLPESKMMDFSIKDSNNGNRPGKQVDLSKMKQFFGKMDVLDKNFDHYQNDIIRILTDFLDSKLLQPNPYSPERTQNDNEINFLSLNLSRLIANEAEKAQNPQTFLAKKNQAYCETNTFLNTQEIAGSNNHLLSDNENSEPKMKYYELKVAIIHWNNEVCLLLVLSDITKSKKIIELKNLDKHKNQLLASISHDLRTPLNGVIGMINATLKELKETKVTDFLKIALNSANLLDFLIKDILDFSQTTYKQLRLNIEEFQIRAVIQDVFSLMRFQAYQNQFWWK